MHKLMSTVSLILLGTALSAQALQVKPVSNNETITATVSANAKTRIFVKNGFIAGMRGTPGSYTYVNDDTNGQVYITPTPDYKNKPFGMFITTKAGQIYRLNLTPKNQPSDSIMLVPNEQVNRHAAQSFETDSAYNQTLVRLIRYMVNGTQPEGYSIEAVANAKPVWLGNIASVQLKAVYEGDRLTGHIYQLTNQLDKTIRIDERELYRTNTRAIAIASSIIPAHGSTLVYEVVNHD